jgi:hypothetical protein
MPDLTRSIIPPVANVSGTHAVGAIATTDAQSLTRAVESAVGATTPESSYQSQCPYRVRRTSATIWACSLGEISTIVGRGTATPR